MRNTEILQDSFIGLHDELKVPSSIQNDDESSGNFLRMQLIFSNLNERLLQMENLLFPKGSWIDINDRKPPNDVLVLACILDTRPDIQMTHIEIVERMENKWLEPRHGEEALGKHCVVTHWMPIPEKP